jgi:hypothetical protein
MSVGTLARASGKESQSSSVESLVKQSPLNLAAPSFLYRSVGLVLPWYVRSTRVVVYSYVLNVSCHLTVRT